MRDKKSERAAIQTLLAVETLDMLSWALSVRAYNRLRVTMRVGGGILVAIATVASVDLARGLLATGAATNDSWIIVYTGLFAANSYATVVYAARELFSTRRSIVSDSPNIEFLRSLDLPQAEVYRVYVGKRIVRFFFILLLIDSVFTISIAESLRAGEWANITAILGLPVSACLALLALSTRSALIRKRSRVVTSLIHIAVSGALGLTLGAGISLLATYTFRSATAGEIPAIITTFDWVSIVICEAVVALGSGFLLLRFQRQLHQHSWVISSAQSTNSTSTDTPPRSTRISLARRLLIEQAHGRGHIITARIASGAYFLSSLAIGAITAAPSDWAIGVPSEPVQSIAVFVSLSTGFLLVETVFSSIGPGTLAGQLRYAWEAGVSALRLSATLHCVHIVTPAFVGIPVAVAATLLSGGLTLTPLLTLIGVFSAAAIANSIAPSVKLRADGTQDQTIFAAIMTVFLSLPVALLSVLIPQSGAWFAAFVRWRPR